MSWASGSLFASFPEVFIMSSAHHLGTVPQHLLYTLLLVLKESAVTLRYQVKPQQSACHGHRSA